MFFHFNLYRINAAWEIIMKKRTEILRGLCLMMAATAMLSFAGCSGLSVEVEEETITNSSGEMETVNVVDPEAVLKELAKYCTTATIDFKLTAFKDDPTYGSLYTELTNEDAISFLDSTTKLNLLVNYCDNNWNSTNGHGQFLEMTCFKPGTDETAMKQGNNDASSIYWGNVDKLVTSYEKSLYGINQTWVNDNNVYQLVEILNAAGEKTGVVVDAIASYNPNTIFSAGEGFCFINKILNSNNEESGFQDIYYYDVQNDECTYLFENVENNDSSEINSFTMGGDYVYCSLAKGFDVTNVKINIKTQDATTLSTNQKLTSIIVVK